jgi:hypothetical protein
VRLPITCEHLLGVALGCGDLYIGAPGTDVFDHALLWLGRAWLAGVPGWDFWFYTYLHHRICFRCCFVQKDDTYLQRPGQRQQKGLTTVPTHLSEPVLIVVYW